MLFSFSLKQSVQYNSKLFNAFFSLENQKKRQCNETGDTKKYQDLMFHIIAESLPEMEKKTGCRMNCRISKFHVRERSYSQQTISEDFVGEFCRPTPCYYLTFFFLDGNIEVSK